MKEYFDDLIEDLSDLAEDIKEHLSMKPLRRPHKIHRKVKKKVVRSGRPAFALAERIRGVIYVIVSISIIYATIIAFTEGIAGLREIVIYLIRSWVGRIIALLIGIAYLIYGIWKIIMGSD